MPKREKKPREYRGVIDEIREQQMKTKDMSAKGKWEYFWDYYKVHTIVIILVLVFGGALIHDIVSAKDYCFSAVMMNATLLSADAMGDSFAEYAQLDTETYQCFIDTSTTLSLHSYDQYGLATVQKIMAQMQTGDLDVLVYDSELFNNYAPTQMFLDLRDALTPEELTLYQDQLYYIDYAEILREEEASESEEMDASAGLDPYDEASVLAETERHRHPEAMEDPIPVGIFLTDSPFAQKSGAYANLEPIFGITATSHRYDTSKKYLEFLWDDTIDFSQMINSDLF